MGASVPRRNRHVRRLRCTRRLFIQRVHPADVEALDAEHAKTARELDVPLSGKVHAVRFVDCPRRAQSYLVEWFTHTRELSDGARADHVPRVELAARQGDVFDEGY